MLSLTQHVYDRLRHQAWSPVLFLTASILHLLVVPPAHSLLVSGTSAVFVFLIGLVKSRNFEYTPLVARNVAPSLLAGSLLGVARICERAAWTSHSVWWALTLIPAFTCFISSSLKGIESSPSVIGMHSPAAASTLAASTMTALVAATPATLSVNTLCLSLCTAFLTSYALIILNQELQTPRRISGLVLLDEKSFSLNGDSSFYLTLRDTAGAMSLVCGIAAFFFDASPKASLTTPHLMAQASLTVIAQAFQLLSFMYSISLGSSITPSALLSDSALLATALRKPSGLNLIFGGLSICLLHLCSDLPSSKSSGSRLFRRGVVLLTLLSFGILGYLEVCEKYMNAISSFEINFNVAIPQSITADEYKLPQSRDIHPIRQLADLAAQRWHAVLDRQPQSISDAILKYEARYHLHPPPLFDVWYEFAKERDVVVLDDYDAMFESLLPFWALEPAIIRSRVREAIGYAENGLIALIIREGKVITVEGGQQWQQNALLGLISSFVHFLPDMDIAVNMHDEPRIVVPHDELSWMVQQARQHALPDALRQARPDNSFSSPPEDYAPGSDYIPDVKTSRFNDYSQQNTWIPSRLSCSPDSPARHFSGSLPDDTSSFAFTELGFVYNSTASSDVCSLPSLRSQHGFFDRPNAFKVAHELIPIFSESKVSSFQDILFPSMWHWNRAIHTNRTSDMHLPGHSKPMYNAMLDVPWAQKNNTMWWRGSTTGGFSRDGGWRRQHRQRIIKSLNADDVTSIMVSTTTPKGNVWQTSPVRRHDYQQLFDVHFSGVGQCDPGDCRAQEEFFDMKPHADFEEAWQNKHVLDMDGNAFSARFYALLQSKSLVYKMAIFQEWHQERIEPWLHYVPMSLQGHEHLELVRYFAQEEEGIRLAPQLADGGSTWAQTALRREDMEVWMFRLLLEYGRVIDDRRSVIGYTS